MGWPVAIQLSFGGQPGAQYHAGATQHLSFT